MNSNFLFSNMGRISLLPLVIFLASCAELKKTTEDMNDKKKAIVNQKKLDEAKGITMLLPINCIVKPKINLAVEIPSDFQSYLPLDQMVKSSMNEFFPKRDKGIDNWSEIITTKVYVGQRATAKQVADSIKNGISSDATTSKVIKTQDKTLKNYATSEFSMIYTYQGKREVIFAKYYSGQYDCAGFQYTIRLTNNMSEDQALRKINDFVENRVDLIG